MTYTEAQATADIGMHIINIDNHFTLTAKTKRDLTAYFAYLLNLRPADITEQIFSAFVEDQHDLEHYMDILGYIGDTKTLAYPAN